MRYLLQDRLSSIIWMVTWAACFSGAMTLVKFLENTPLIVLVCIRFVFSVALVVPFLMRGGRQAFTTRRFSLHMFNAVLRCLGIFATYYAYSNLPMGLAASIGYTGPMIAIVLAMLVLKEKVGWRKWVAVIIGYVGVLIMAQPDQMDVNIAMLVALFANLTSSTAKVVTKEITKVDNTLQIMFYTNGLSIVLSGAAMGVMWQAPPAGDWIFIFGIALLGSMSQFAYLRALHHGTVSLVAPFEYLRFTFAIPIGYLIFNEVLTYLHAIGCSIIIACSIYLTWREVQRDAPAG